MIPSLRKKYNDAFLQKKYEAFIHELEAAHPGQLDFRVAETPVFIPKDFNDKILDACESIIDIITDPKYKGLTKNSIPGNFQVPNENEHTQFIAFDFGVCINADGEYEPQLIEMQGFPSLFAYEILLDDMYRKHFQIPENFSCYLNGLNRATYIEQLKKIILNNYPPENVVLLEIFPFQQKTRIDFFCTKEYLGIPIICLTEVIKEGKQLFYMHEGKKIRIKRIYNRVIFDELHQQSEEVQKKGKILLEELEVEWCPHPNWFYRISKYTLPFIRHPYVPKTYFLHEVKQVPSDLENYVLKPLFSFAGQGVVIDVTQKDLDNIADPENWILQRKVQYADIIPTPDVPAKAEIRMFYFWDENAKRPVAANNLGRMSKGKMIGVRYNKDKEWVGGNCCYFEK
ncbi:MAG: hypothetical protein R2796_05965 [Chitinophagaceae bacterium]|nr:hypothetical protein [Chitinophagaceae bacterium]